jgi:hypothetical protein
MSKRRRPRKSQFRRVVCKCGCRRMFVKSTYNHIYATKACKDRVGQRLLRERAKLYPERVAEQLGANGRQP